MKYSRLDAKSKSGPCLTAEALSRLEAILEEFAYDRFLVLEIAFAEGRPRSRILLEDGRAAASSAGANLLGEKEEAIVLDHILRSSAPLRWHRINGPQVQPIDISARLFRDSSYLSPTVSGLCVPVHSGMNRVGGVIFLGGGRSDLTMDDICALRLFCVSWFAEWSHLMLGEGTFGRITRRELECLQLAAHGMTSEAIAEHLQLSKHTVNHHLISVTTKLNASNRTHAIAIGCRTGLIH